MPPLTRRAFASAALWSAAVPARASGTDVSQLRVSYGYSIGYLPLMVMRDQKLIEKHASQAGLDGIAVTWRVEDGGNNINDAMLAGLLDIAGVGIPGYLVLRDRTRGKRQEVVGITALNSGALWLNTINPRIRTLADYGPGDRIALPGIKTSYAAVVLQMAAAKELGMANYAKLDPLTVGMPHPEAYAALMSGKTEITSHMASPPFSYQELKNPAVHRVLSTKDVLGSMTILMTMAQKALAEANPKLIAAYLAAQEEANAFIQAQPQAAADAYGRGSGLKVPNDELLAMLADPENAYSLTPSGSLAYARFLGATGTLKATPDAWSDLFIPELRSRGGS